MILRFLVCFFLIIFLSKNTTFLSILGYDLIIILYAFSLPKIIHQILTSYKFEKTINAIYGLVEILLTCFTIHLIFDNIMDIFK